MSIRSLIYKYLKSSFRILSIACIAETLFILFYILLRCRVLNIQYYLSKQNFETLLSVISAILPKGSSIIFDYPDENSYTKKAGERAKKQSMLAGAANEQMLASYSYAEMEQLLSAHDFLIYEHLTPQEMTEEYFESYNKANPSHRMTAFDNVNYCLAVRK